MTADEFRALRLRLGMTQVELAKALDCTVSSIANYEGVRGLYRIPVVTQMAVRALAGETREQIEESAR